MNPARQFWTLLKFHLSANPYIWFYCIGFCAPFLFMPMHDMSFSFIVPMQNIFFVGLLGVMLLAPEILYTGWAGGQWAAFSGEFLLTRAVDRYLLARAKAASLFLMALIVPLLVFSLALRNPELRVSSYTKMEQQACLAHVPNSSLHKDKYGRESLLVIPAGSVFVAAWHIWEVLAAALLVQAVIVFIYRLRFRKYIFMGAFFLVAFSPLLGIGSHSLSLSEMSFFIFAGHQLSAWAALALIFLLIQCLWERRFAGFEQ